MKDVMREDPKVVAAAERQMRAHEFAEQLADRGLRADQAHQPSGKIGHFVSISREAGAGGGEVAQLLGTALGWEVMDKNLLDQVAERFRLSRSMLELVDETPSTWVYDMLGAWMDRKIIPHEKFVVDLERIILAAARRGNTVFVGRGAQFLLPRTYGIAVRLIASEKFRVDRVTRLMNLTPEQARNFVVEVDRGRKEFAERYFHHDITDPHLYDLVVNSERVGLPETADLIVQLCRRRGFVGA